MFIHQLLKLLCSTKLTLCTLIYRSLKLLSQEKNEETLTNTLQNADSELAPVPDTH